MPSAIDATKPVAGSPTTESVRANFAAAKSEIELLQQTAGVGPIGPIGPIGPSGTMSVGTVTTGIPGSNATVNNSGTPQAAILNFTIPRGDAGTGGGGITETQAINAVRQGQVRFEEAVVTTAPTWPTTPNLAGAPVLGAGWTLVSGSGATATYTHAMWNWEPLSYPATIISGDWYQVVYIATRTTPIPEYGDTEINLHLGTAANSFDYHIRDLVVGGSQTIVFQAPGNATHVLIEPNGDYWAGNFTLTRIVRYPGPQNSQALNIKDFAVIVLTSSLYEGQNGSGRFATGTQNTIIGTGAGRSLTSGSQNTAIGNDAFAFTVTAGSNTAVGHGSLRGSGSGGSNNSAYGGVSMYRFASGERNSAHGHWSMYELRSGSHNSGFGCTALYFLQAGNSNTGCGYWSGSYHDDSQDRGILRADDSVFVGTYSNGADNSTNQIVIGAHATGHGSDTITLGNTDIAALHCNVQTISALSDSRVKANIQPANLDLCLNAVRNLPLSRWAWQAIAGAHPDHHVTGFLADDVAKVFPKSVTKETRRLPVRNENGDVQMTASPVRPQPKGAQPPDENAAPPDPLVPKTQEFKDLQHVSLQEILPTLWGAVQRIIAQIDDIERRLAQQPKPLPGQ